ncbi:MAG: hypothetical protein J7J91_01225, partial [Deltaproteobacteria bacterium]|nr:hypothetical protein [Deltaproteobacteria bacterium]
ILVPMLCVGTDTFGRSASRRAAIGGRPHAERRDEGEDTVLSLRSLRCEFYTGSNLIALEASIFQEAKLLPKI